MTNVVRGRELPRKTLHLTTASVPLGLWLGVPQQLMAIALVSLFGVACALEFARRRSTIVASRFEATVGVMLRQHEVNNGITGATWLLATFAITCLLAPWPAVIAGTWAGAVGDGSAALVGRSWRAMRGGTGKTVVGSVACAVTSAIGAWWLAGFSVPAALVIGVVAASVERPSLSLDDNVRVTAAAAVAAAVLLRV